MAAAPPPPGPPPRAQRAWRAACPGCGAPVEFASAASASAVCSFCRTTVVRDGEALRRIGVSAELFDDHSPLQLGARGRHQGVPFTVVGRLQYAYAEGTWSEWHLLFETDPPGEGGGAAPRSGWLSEDNGAYVLAFDVVPPPPGLPPADELHAGERRLVAGTAWNVASVVRARLLAAEGELPRPPRLAGEFVVADLRSTADEVGTLDYAEPAAPAWSVGRAVALASLDLSGLRETSEKTLSARGVPCPSCGAALAPTLATTRSMSCPQCRAVVDLSAGVGAELAHYAQNNAGAGGLAPQIPLGRTGRLALGAEGPLDWTVIGYLERCDLPAPGDDSEEQTFWREYLLYHRSAGFAFLVDAEDGWSWVRPMTGAPRVSGRSASVQGTSFTERWRYAAKVTWVQGEFYWQVRRDERAEVTDYDGPGGARLSCEKTADEVVWSLGRTIDAASVARAFGIAPGPGGGLARDATPLSGLAGQAGGGSGGLSQGVIVLAVVIAVIVLMSRCSGDDCDEVKSSFGESSAEYQQCLRNQRSGGLRSSGGSFGGFSSGGGGHK